MSPTILDKLTKTLLAWLNNEAPPPKLPLSDFTQIQEKIKPCDVLLVEGRSRVDNIIKSISCSPWSHSALYIGKLADIKDPIISASIKINFDGEPETPLIIENHLGQGTIIHPLTFYKNDHVRICRPKGIGYKDAQEVVRYAVSRVGTNHNKRQLLDLIKLLTPWAILPKKWRIYLFTKNAGLPTRTICASMIAEAFAFIQFPIFPLTKRISGTELQLFRRNPKLCTPSDFDYSPYFEIIKYPFIDLSEHSSDRIFPWKSKASITNQATESLPPLNEEAHQSNLSHFHQAKNNRDNNPSTLQ